MTAKNEAIGKVECPAKGCTLEIPVFRFRPRPTQRMQRFANKLYCRCPKHGQFGGAAGDDEMQSYIEEHAVKCEPAPADNVEPAQPAIQQEVPAPAKPAPVARAPATRPAAPTATLPATSGRKGLLDW